MEKMNTEFVTRNAQKKKRGRQLNAGRVPDCLRIQSFPFCGL